LQPFQPSYLFPMGGECIDGDDVNIFAWLFTDPTPTDNQSAYQIQYKKLAEDSVLVDSGYIMSIIPIGEASSVEFPKNTFDNGETYAWRVRVKDSSTKVNLFPTDKASKGDEVFADTGWLESTTNTEAFKVEVNGISYDGYVFSYKLTNTETTSKGKIFYDIDIDNIPHSDGVTKLCFSAYVNIPIPYPSSGGATLEIEQFNNTTSITNTLVKSTIINATSANTFKRISVTSTAINEATTKIRVYLTITGGTGSEVISGISTLFSNLQLELGKSSAPTSYTTPSSFGFQSEFSDWVIFNTSYRPKCEIVYPPYTTTGYQLKNEMPTIRHSYTDEDDLLQTSYQYKIYSIETSELVWSSKILTDSYNLQVVPKNILIQSKFYNIQVEVINSKGLKGVSELRRCYADYIQSSSEYNFIVTPDNENSKILIDFNNSNPSISNYIGIGDPRYYSAKYDKGIEVSQYGEKVHWNISIPSIFTITNWFIPKGNTKTILYLHQDVSNYLRFKYDNINNMFILEVLVDGRMRTLGSPVTSLVNGQPVFYCIKQNLLGASVYTGVNGILNKWGDY